MASSVIVALRQAVVAGLKAQPALSGVSVTYHYPWGSHEREKVFTNNARAETPPAALRAGRNFREETGTFDVVIRVEVPGGLAEDADSRVIALGQVVEEFVADRKGGQGLGVSGLLFIRQQGWALVNAGAESGSASELTYTFLYSARIT